MPEKYIHSVCASIYEETRLFYKEMGPLTGNLGFKILYGPPHFRPRILFVGFQPGGDIESKLSEPHAHTDWLPECEYATADWKLARKLQDMFGKELLRQSVGLNAIFFRGKSVAKYHSTVSFSIRKKIQEFCLPKVEKIIETLQPQTIVVIGFGSLAIFGELCPRLLNKQGRVLIKAGKINHREAVATLHLSGARISNIDRESIKKHILGLIRY